MGLKSRLQSGAVQLRGYEFEWSVRRAAMPDAPIPDGLANLHLGPGPGWSKPDGSWLTVDADPGRGDIICDFNRLQRLPLAAGSAGAVYGSHVFEHMHPVAARFVFSECHRVLRPGGWLRIVAPDALLSIERFIDNDESFPLFERRRTRARERDGHEYTLFECLREDFISMSGQENLLGRNALAHQNAWDYPSMVADLTRAGFSSDRIHRVDFQQSNASDFSFEGTYPSEANEADRSMYVEAQA